MGFKRPKYNNGLYYCPDCDSQLVEILYGLYRQTPEEVDRGEAVLGGCIRRSACYACRKCHHAFEPWKMPIEYFERGIKQPANSQDVDELLASVRSGDPDQLRSALKTLTQIGCERAVPLIRQRISETRNPLTIQSLVHALWIIGLHDVSEDLKMLVTNQHRWIRHAAACGLKWLSLEGVTLSDEMIQKVEDILNDIGAPLKPLS